MMAAGKRDRLVTIQELAQPDDVGESGFPVEEWSDLTTVWTQKSDDTMRERFTGEQVSASFDSEWLLPYLQDMDPELLDVPKTRRIVYLSRVYDIVGAEQVGRKAGIRVLTLAGARVS